MHLDKHADRCSHACIIGWPASERKMHLKQMHALQSYGGERGGSFNYTQEMMTRDPEPKGGRNIPSTEEELAVYR